GQMNKQSTALSTPPRFPEAACPVRYWVLSMTLPNRFGSGLMPTIPPERRQHWTTSLSPQSPSRRCMRRSSDFWRSRRRQSAPELPGVVEPWLWRAAPVWVRNFARPRVGNQVGTRSARHASRASLKDPWWLSLWLLTQPDSLT